jgi:hypothetical protein
MTTNYQTYTPFKHYRGETNYEYSEAELLVISEADTAKQQQDKISTIG